MRIVELRDEKAEKKAWENGTRIRTTYMMCMY